MPRRTQTNMRLGPPLAEEPLGEHAAGRIVVLAARHGEPLLQRRAQIDVMPAQGGGAPHRAVHDNAGGGHADADDMVGVIHELGPASCSMSSIVPVSSAPNASSDRYSIVPSRSVTAPWMNRDCDRVDADDMEPLGIDPEQRATLALAGVLGQPALPDQSFVQHRADHVGHRTRESPVRLPICARESSVAGNSSPKINARLFRRTSDGSALDVCPGARKATGGVEGFMAFLLSVLGNGWPLPWILHCIGSPL